MKNIEKYKDNILNTHHADLSCCVHSEILKLDCVKHCSECKKHAIEWLLEEYKEPILDDAERKYLTAVIKPFRKNVIWISKQEKGYEDDVFFIAIVLNGSERIHLPYFNTKSGMYMGMDSNKWYTLQELGL